VARELLEAPILMRLAYTGLDGTPRVIPIAFYWDGARLLVGTIPSSPKVGAIERNPRVAATIDTDTDPPRVLLIRGEATIEVIDGVLPEYLDGARRRYDADRYAAFEAEVRGLYKQMARIAITPTWVKVLDFETRLPEAVEELIRQRR
jgi:pyridoxamine 5'-phosphate oxidase-like protein